MQDRRAPLDVFIGRAAELARGAEVVSRVEAGQPWLVAIEGDPGMGTTALARRCLAGAPGLKVLSARADQAETDLDSGIVDQLLGPSPLRSCVLGTMAFTARQLAEAQLRFGEALAQAPNDPDSRPLAGLIAYRLAGTYTLLGDGEQVQAFGLWALGTGCLGRGGRQPGMHPDLDRRLRSTPAAGPRPAAAAHREQEGTRSSASARRTCCSPACGPRRSSPGPNRSWPRVICPATWPGGSLCWR